MTLDYQSVINHLYIGNRPLKTDFFHLIVNCTHEIPFSYFSETRVRIPVNDDLDDCEKIIRLILQTNVLQKIHNCVLQNQNVLVHCTGSEYQRSFTIVACYLIQYYKYTPIQAVHFIFEKNIPLDTIRFINAIKIFYYYCKHKHKFI